MGLYVEEMTQKSLRSHLRASDQHCEINNNKKEIVWSS